MIKLSNGHSLELVVASGALAFDGNGWWFHQPFRWLNKLRPSEFDAIITKTLTFKPRKGNYKWYAPWTSFRFLSHPSNSFKPHGCANNIALTNPGYMKWLTWFDKKYPFHTDKQPEYKLIPSIMVETEGEAVLMAKAFNQAAHKLVAIEINMSCPNVYSPAVQREAIRAFCHHTKLPVIIKMGYQQDYVEITKSMVTLSVDDMKIEAIDLINAVPANILFSKEWCDARLGNLPHTSGISGPKIREMAYKALTDVKSNWQARQKPVISGGGVGSLEDIEYRLNVLGADAVAIGTMFTLSPTLPNQINSQLKLKPKRECPECGSTYTSSFLTRAPAALRDATTVTVRQCKETPCAFAWMDDEASNQLTLAQFKREKRMGLRRSRFCTPEEKELWDKA